MIPDPGEAVRAAVPTVGAGALALLADEQLQAVALLIAAYGLQLLTEMVRYRREKHRRQLTAELVSAGLDDPTDHGGWARTAAPPPQRPEDRKGRR